MCREHSTLMDLVLVILKGHDRLSVKALWFLESYYNHSCLFAYILSV